MLRIDLNCDMGEDTGNDAAIMPWISSANISCGWHAGSESGIRETIALCFQHGVAIGAHPSWPDRENFGRTEMQMEPDEIYHHIKEQLHYFSGLLNGAQLHHVKPHGALYNQSARDPQIAAAVARAVKDVDPSLILYGLSGSCSLSEAAAIGLRTAAEVFADRSYCDDGSLTPRSQSGAQIEDVDQAVAQALQLIIQKSVRSVFGNTIPLQAETICLHGDGAHAVAFAKTIHQHLKQQQIEITTL